jgi:hypothetical protein
LPGATRIHNVVLEFAPSMSNGSSGVVFIRRRCQKLVDVFLGRIAVR